MFITASDRTAPRYEPRPIGSLQGCLDAGLDIGRSLWDRSALLLHLDVDYVNFAFPAGPHLDPPRSFAVQRPVFEAIEAVLGGYGIPRLRLLSGRGHHVLWQVAEGSPAWRRLTEIGRVPPSMRGRYSAHRGPQDERVSPELAAAYAGARLLMEYMGHRVLAAAAPRSALPVTLTEVRVGTGRRGPEIVAVDISEYGDPLHTRGIRAAYSAYFKPMQRRSVLGERVVEDLPASFVIPMGELSTAEGLALMRGAAEVRRYARDASAAIPDGSRPTAALIEDYHVSSLARFHDAFYGEPPHPPAAWRDTYDRMDLDALPPCGRRPLACPNDLLLKPECIQHVVRLLMADGWHPRHIAGLIRSKYERDFGWGSYWYTYDATGRADFYVRLFAGLFWTGRDDLVDFNCVSGQEKGHCRAEECAHDLEDWRDRLLGRRVAHV